MAVELGFGLIRGLVTGTYLANINASIKDMVDAFEQWRWHLFEQLVPASVLLQIAAVKASYGLRVSDKLCWGVTMNKQFAQLMGFGVGSILVLFCLLQFGVLVVVPGSYLGFL
ncbi:hypothetical protein V6N11_061818, partial [Hibiscus sabdariffa]